jgi:hypothetical protein
MEAADRRFDGPITGDGPGPADGINHSGMRAARQHDEAFVLDVDDESLLVPDLIRREVPITADLPQSGRAKRLRRRALEGHLTRYLAGREDAKAEVHRVLVGHNPAAVAADQVLTEPVVVERGSPAVTHDHVPRQERVRVSYHRQRRFDAMEQGVDPAEVIWVSVTDDHLIDFARVHAQSPEVMRHGVPGQPDVEERRAGMPALTSAHQQAYAALSHRGNPLRIEMLDQAEARIAVSAVTLG